MSDTTDGPQRHAISCINCRTRKVKCDKVYPCGPCQKLQVDCLFRAKKARPKKAVISKSRSSDINSRLDRLDQLVTKLGSFQHQLPSDVQSLLTNSTPEELARPETGPGTGRPPKEPFFGKGYPQMRSEFWMNLSDEVEGLRHTLYVDATDDEEDESSEDDVQTYSSITTGMTMAPFVLGGSKTQMQGRKHPSAAEVLRLSEIFFERVDTIFKYLHVPTVRSLVGRVVAEGEKPMLTKPEQALTFSMYFSAVNTMQDREYALMKQDRRSALMYYKSCTEAALAEADLLCTTDIVTLQAFVTYLLALRSIDSSQATWSLIGLAIRLAQALDLHRDTACTKIPPYDIQMRRRLYWQLCLMDIQAFQDRGLSPLLQSTVLSFPTMPANIDDSDFGPDSRDMPVSRVAFTEMTVPILCFLTTQTALRMASQSNSLIQPDNKYVSENLRSLHDKLCESVKLFDMSKPICWFSKLVCRVAILKIFLLAHIPVHVRLRKSQPEITRQDVLTLCVTIMELHNLAQDKEPMNRFAWYHANWHQWHPLAVALAELVSVPTGSLADRAWMVVSENFNVWKTSVADGRKGSLWRPIKKLYDKARRARAHALGIKSNTPSSNGDISSPAADLAISRRQDTGEGWHRLHDAALKKALGLAPGESSLLLFLGPDQTQRTPDSMLSETGTPMDVSGCAPGQDSAINWDEWDTFLRESYESTLIGSSGPFDESLMQGIMDMPLDMNVPAANLRGQAPPSLADQDFNGLYGAYASNDGY